MAENRSMADRGTGGQTRRRWSVARKAAILAELGEPGATLSVVARRHAIAPSLLHRWRSDATDECRPALPRFAEVIADVVAPHDAARQPGTEPGLLRRSAGNPIQGGFPRRRRRPLRGLRAKAAGT